MPVFEENEKGPHKPDLLQKETSPPKMYTEASLLRAMETAGKQVDDEELSQAMKENGIGRPSTRANIIETLFKRKYVVRQRKNLVPTETGVGLIHTIQNDLLKSVELTGMWENKLRQIERGEYEAATFMDEMKTMVSELVYVVKTETGRSIAIQEQGDKNKKTTQKKQENTSKLDCPKCGSAVLKGNKAYGCSKFQKGCDFVLPFVQFEKKLTDKQIQILIQKKKTRNIKGLSVNGKKTEGILSFDSNYKVIFSPKEVKQAATVKELQCPKCKSGIMLRGKQAYGCSKYNNGCMFLIPFSSLQEKFSTDVLQENMLVDFV